MADKRVTWNWQFLSGLDNQELRYWLTDRQAAALINVARQMQWSTRWGDNVPEDDFKRFASEVAHRLSSPVDNPCEYPFWDEYTVPPNVDTDCDEDDPDDENQESEQSKFWQVADWVITGFLAVSSTPAAAITYQTLAPRVRILLQRRTLGAVADFIVNGVIVSSVDTSTGAGPAGELVENIIDITELVNNGTVPENTAGNVIELVKSSVPAASASVASFGEFMAQNQNVETELAVVTGNITYDENNGDVTVTPEMIADGIKLYQQSLCDCISGTDGDSRDGSFVDENDDGFDDETGVAIPTNEAQRFGESVAVARYLDRAIADVSAEYNQVSGLATAVDDLSDFMVALYGMSQADAQSLATNIDAGAAFIPQLTNSQVVDMGSEIWGRAGTRRGNMAYWILVRSGWTNSEERLGTQFVDALPDSTLDEWEAAGSPDERYVGSRYYLWPVQQLTVTPNTDNVRGEPVDWRLRSRDTLVRVSSSGELTHPAGHILRGNFAYNASSASWGWSPVEIARWRQNEGRWDGFQVARMQFDEYPRGRNAFTGTIRSVRSDSNVNIGIASLAVRDVRTVAGVPRSEFSGNMTFTIQDLGES